MSTTPHTVNFLVKYRSVIGNEFSECESDCHCDMDKPACDPDTNECVGKNLEYINAMLVYIFS